MSVSNTVHILMIAKSGVASPLWVFFLLPRPLSASYKVGNALSCFLFPFVILDANFCLPILPGSK